MEWYVCIWNYITLTCLCHFCFAQGVARRSKGSCCTGKETCRGGGLGAVTWHHRRNRTFSPQLSQLFPFFFVLHNDNEAAAWNMHNTEFFGQDFHKRWVKVIPKQDLHNSGLGNLVETSLNKWTQLDPVLTTSRGGEDGWSGAGRRGAGRVTGWAWEHLGATGSNRHKLSSAGTSWHQDKKLLKETKLWTQLGRRSVGNQESATGRHDNFEENCVDIAWWRTIEHMKALKMVMTCFKRNSGLSSTVRKLRPREKGYYHGRLGTVATSKTKLWRQGRA